MQFRVIRAPIRHPHPRRRRLPGCLCRRTRHHYTERQHEYPGQQASLEWQYAGDLELSQLELSQLELGQLELGQLELSQLE